MGVDLSQVAAVGKPGKTGSDVRECDDNRDLHVEPYVLYIYIHICASSFRMYVYIVLYIHVCISTCR